MTIFDLIALSLMGVGMGFSLMGISTAVLFSPFIVAIYGSRMGNGIMFLPFFIADLYVSWQYRKSFTISRGALAVPFIFIGVALAKILLSKIAQHTFNFTIVLLSLVAAFALLF